MTWSELLPRRNGGATLYALPLTAGEWSASGAVVGNNSEQPRIYVFTGLVDGVDYGVYLRAGEEPAESDDRVARLDYTPDAESINYGDLSAAIALQLRRLAVKASGIAATSVVVKRGTTWRIPLAILPDGWTRVEVTGRVCGSDKQAASLFHVRLSNPAAAGEDGLRRFASKEITGDRSAGSISAGDDETAAVCSIDASTTSTAEHGEFAWDAKVWTADGVDPIAGGDMIVERDVTRTAA